MNIPLLIANFLTFAAFLAHTFVGDKEFKPIEPLDTDEKDHKKRQSWTQARSGWHMVSVDLLLASIGLAIINFSDWFTQENSLLQILSVYFAAYGLAWLIGLTISRPFPKKYLNLGQWILLWVIAGLLFWGSQVNA